MTAEIAHVRSVFAPHSPALAAFDYLLAHAGAAAFRFIPYGSAVRSVELQWPDRRRNPFSAQANPNYVNFYLRSPILTEHPELFSSATTRFGRVPKNSRGEYRKRLANPAEVDEMLAFLREQGAWPAHRHDRRFLAATFAPITGEHFLHAAQSLVAGDTAHRFGESTTYDLLFDGHKLPPKAVFGLAATEALGFPVGPENFTAGEGALSFRMLRAHGYPIVAKRQNDPQDPILASDEDQTWTEGRLQLVQHLRRERATGLAAAKRDRFRAEHGKLFCERCNMDPIEVFGSPIGEACIEVHHREEQVSEMREGHITRLEDLMCLCANCHRVTHHELKDALSVEQL